MNASNDCRAARDALATPPGDVELEQSYAAHRASCPECTQFMRALDDVRQLATAHDHALDDLTRVRIGANIAASIAEPLAVSPRRYRTPGLLVAAACAAMLLAWFGWRARPSAKATLRAFAVSGPAALSNTTLGQPLEKLEVPAGSELRATFGAATVLALHGPARLSVVGASRLRLEAGRVLVRYDHSAGGGLAVEAPGMVVSVVGTAFAVETDGVQSGVAVAHGVVEVAADARVTRVTGGGAFQLDEAAHSRLSAALSEELARGAPPPGASATLLVDSENARLGEIKMGAVALGRAPLRVLVAPGATIVDADGSAPQPATFTVDRITRVSMLSEKKIAEVPTMAAAITRPRAPTPLASASPGHRATLAVLAPRATDLEEISVPPLPTVAPSMERLPVADEALPPPKATAPTPSIAPDESAEALYGRAESAMRSGDDATAHQSLKSIVRRHPHDPLADVALYDLARLANSRGNVAEARANLDELLMRGAEPAHWLRCRLTLGEPRPAVSRCMTAFRRDFSSSPHDPEALAVLIGEAQADGDCASARQLIAEYLRLYPTGSFADEAKARSQKCGR